MRTAAILAGGRATRLGGRDKSALVVGGRPILSRQVAMLTAVDGVDEILIVGHATHPSARTIADVVPGCGPLGGIHAALAEARHETVFVLACDTPYPTASLVAHLFSLADGVDVVVPRTEQGYHPLCAVYSRGCLDPIAQRLAAGHLKVIDLVDDVRARVVSGSELERFGDPQRLFTNVNTPADYARCRHDARRQQGVAAVHDHKL
jgi:molybdopterin-guanine dinucleotide biosynthesis protein A